MFENLRFGFNESRRVSNSRDLEAEFHGAMVGVYRRALKEAGYIATRYIQMVAEHGGVEAAKTLVSSAAPSDGFTKLWELGRLDLTVEALVSQDRWAPLFDAPLVGAARERLESYGYRP